MSILWVLIRRLILWILLATYIGLYAWNARRYAYPSLGGIPVVIVDYRVSFEVSIWVFYPVHWIDSRILRPKYWERYPDSYPAESQW